MDLLKMYFLLKMGIFHCYVSLLEDSRFLKIVCVLFFFTKFAPFVVGAQE